MATPLYLPGSLPYPIQVLSIDIPVSKEVTRGARLLSYSFTVAAAAGAVASEGDAPAPETRFGTWDSPLEGTVDRWVVKVGQLLSAPFGRQTAVVYVKEPCTHDVQISGMCAVCGKDMTNADYTGFSDTSRASIRMTHDANGPTVSLREAQRLERESASRLYTARKLSLIVDLDQTIVHATVDPTVGEWIAEGEAWEAAHASSSKVQSKSPDPEQAQDAEDDDEVNPNWEALKDVKRFRLAPESFAPHSREKGKNKPRVEDEGCLPGWKEFLDHLATKYEMHVYTMGTRAYAEEVCAALDPDKALFGGRILSRDESGSLTQKNLQRLFPSDTSMVVIIDDRADVWEWSPNLIKVIPYDFFVGIGDINSAFLPKLDPILAGPDQKPSSTSNKTTPVASATPVSSAAAPLTTDAAKAVQDAEDDAALDKVTQVLDAQLEERPLAKKQDELADADADAIADAASKDGTTEKPSMPCDSVENGKQLDAPPKKAPKAHKQALLKNDDYELIRVQALLDRVHDTFFQAYDTRETRRRGKSAQNGQGSEAPYDVRAIIPPIRSATLAGTHIVFSSVIPLDTRPESTDIWRTAHMFGAICSKELTDRTTHVVAAKRGTAKVDAARRQGGIKIVTLQWFTHSIAAWQRRPEDEYLLDAPPRQQEKDKNPNNDDGETQGSGSGSGASLSGLDADREREMDDSQVGSSDLDFDSDWDDEDDEHDPESTKSTPSRVRIANFIRDGPGAGRGVEAEAGVEGSSRPDVNVNVNKSTKSGAETPALEEEELTGDVDWAALDAEVEAAMNESDTEDGGSERGDLEMDDTAGARSSVSPSNRRKRLRSMTPSEVNGVNGSHDDSSGSRLSKRKRTSADSPLKRSVLANGSPNTELTNSPSAASSASDSTEPSPNGDVGEGDDFLLAELGEEWS